jgi:murein DD-endopeptidase MepM/ murein hydrolase activator NlpD
MRRVLPHNSQAMTPRRVAVGLVMFVLFCGSAHAATTHTVRRGQTLFSIARSYGLSVQTLARANKIGDTSQITVGQRLVIPKTQRAGSSRSDAEPATSSRSGSGTTGPVAAPPSSRSGSGKAGAGPAVPGRPTGRGAARRPVAPVKRPPAVVPAEVRSFSESMRWPVDGPIISPFAAPRRGGHRWHKGIDIKSPEGAPIRAVADGVVAVSADHHGAFGRLVTIDHGEGITTYYGHNSRNLVEAGQKVSAGDVIALVGRTGNASCDHLHFELRKDGEAVDPAKLLPDLRTAGVEQPGPEMAREPEARPAVTRVRYPSERGKGPPPE